MAEPLPVGPSARDVLQSHLPRPGEAPLVEGSVIHLTETEQRMLEQAGWQSGQPVPSLTDYLEQLSKTPVVVPESGPPRTGPVLDFAQLPPDKQIEIQAAIRRAAEEEATRKRKEAQQIPNAGSGVNAAIAAALEPAPSTRPTETKDPVINNKTEQKHENCPHCGWDLSLDVEQQATPEIKRQFFACFMAGTRFERAYSFFGGAVDVLYRTLTVQEADLVLQQLTYDMRDQLFSSYDPGEYHRRNMNYRFSLGVAAVTLNGRIVKVPTFDEWQAQNKTATAPEEPAQTGLRAFYTFFEKLLLTTEMARRTFGVNHARFERFVEFLEARIDDQDFYKGIAS